MPVYLNNFNFFDSERLLFYLKKNFMKTIRIIIFSLIFTGIFSSCNDFFEIPVTSDVTIDSVFSSPLKAEAFLWTVYETCAINGFPGWRDGGVRNGLLMGATDEGDMFGGEGAEDFNRGTWSANNQREFNMGTCYLGIRNANIFMENIDRVAGLTDLQKNQMRSEARFFRTLMHFDAFRRFGGVPIVTQTLDKSGVEQKVPRSTLAQTIQFIVDECDEAAKYLPNSYDRTYKGRVTKGAALALKSRTLLYAASPLFNPIDGKAYYEDGVNDEDFTVAISPDVKQYVCYENYDANRWKVAADAAKAVIDWAENESGWCRVINTGNPFDDYNNATSLNSDEILLNDRSHQTWATWLDGYGNQVRYYTNSIYGSWKRSHGVSLNWTRFYYRSDGSEQIWNENTNPDAAFGNYSEFVNKCKEMEPRFQLSVMYSSPDQIVSGLETNKVIEAWWSADGTKEIVPGGKWMDASMYACYTGVGHLKKFLHNMTHAQSPFYWPVLRLGEFYLNYAEALNETAGIPTQETFDAINVIRRRAGIPELNSASPGCDTRDNFRQVVHRERNIEMFCEEHRFFDVRRWKIADQEGVMKGGIWTLRLYQMDGQTTPNKASVVYKKVKVEDRVWKDYMYLYPYNQGEVNLGYLVQNPGW
jgi:starch-binding outer membrane protein, SusD/RagB family